MEFSVRTFPVLDSTNAEALRQATGGAPAGTVIVAESQTAGRGRRGRAWVSEPGNLHCSVLLDPGRGPGKAALLSFAAALAVAEAIQGLLGKAVTCKWPNDVLLDGKKVAGLLLEFDRERLVIGVGVNIAHHPAETEFPAADLDGAATSPQVLEAFLGHLEIWYETWQKEGFGPLREAWRARAHGLGRPIRVRLADRVLEGVFRDLAEDGALILEMPDGRVERVLAGDVFPAT